MEAIITVVGFLGAGKTTLLRKITHKFCWIQVVTATNVAI